MKILNNWRVAFVLLVLPCASYAVEITGTVREVPRENYATIALDSEARPNVGDPVEIFFKVAGSDGGEAEVSVGNGKVTAVQANSVEAKIDNTTGALSKGQLARIKSQTSQEASSGASSASPSGKDETPNAAATADASANPLLGDWTAPAPGNAKVSFSFKEDNTLLWVIEEPTSAKSTTGKYRVDTTVTPHVVEISGLDQAELKGQTLYGLFELQNDGRLKMDMGDSRERGFSDRETILLSRATTPIVRRPSTPTSSSPPPTAETISFDNLAPGPISEEAFADRGVQLKGTKGEPGIYSADANMVMPPSCRNVLLLAGERVTSLTIVFQNPVKRFKLVRAGAAGGASLPTWTMTAYDGNGKTIGSAGEKHGTPSAAQPFAIEGNGIAHVEIGTDNRNGTGTWATWNSLPIAEFSFDR